jgi:hypothetical protein
MSRTIKAILIDTLNKEVKEVTYTEGENSLKEVYKLLHCNCITSADSYVFNPIGHTLFVDDEGLLVDEPIGAFQIANGQVLSGNGLIVSTDDEGETQSHYLNIEKLKAIVKFRDVADLPEPTTHIFSF